MVKATDVVYKYYEFAFALKRGKGGFEAGSVEVFIGYNLENEPIKKFLRLITPLSANYHIYLRVYIVVGSLLPFKYSRFAKTELYSASLLAVRK